MIGETISTPHPSRLGRAQGVVYEAKTPGSAARSRSSSARETSHDTEACSVSCAKPGDLEPQSPHICTLFDMVDRFDRFGPGEPDDPTN